MKFTDPKTGIEVVAPEECLRLLRTQEVGRLAVVVGGFAAIFPATTSLTRTAEDVRKAANPQEQS